MRRCLVLAPLSPLVPVPVPVCPSLCLALFLPSLPDPSFHSTPLSSFSLSSFYFGPPSSCPPLTLLYFCLTCFPLYSGPLSPPWSIRKGHNGGPCCRAEGQAERRRVSRGLDNTLFGPPKQCAELVAAATRLLSLLDTTLECECMFTASSWTEWTRRPF